MADLPEYLEIGFEPSKVTMPRLRSILVENKVDYPSTAKKAQLVDLVATHVLPKAPRLREQHLQARRTSMGIVNAGSAQDTGEWSEDERPSTRRSKTPRKSSARIKTEPEDEHPLLRSPAKRASRSVSRAVSQPAEPEPQYEAPQSTRRGRRTVTPVVKVEPESSEESSTEEEQEEEPSHYQEEESVFTDDNPFQAGSSPPQAKTPNRRRSSGQALAKVPGSSRRKTGDYSRATSYELKTPKMRKSPARMLSPGEEFTPEEQLELEEAESQGELTVRPRKVVGKQVPSRLKVPLMVFLTAMLVGYGGWYRQEKIAVGYCDVGRNSHQILPDEVRDYVPDAILPLVEPQCEPCPPHAVCYGDFTVRCDPDFVLTQHPLSVNGLIPLPPTCEADSEKARRVQHVADKAVEELRERRAKFECGDLVDEEGKQAESPSIAEDELKQTVGRKRSKKLNKMEFDELWEQAIGDVTGREEVMIETPKQSANSTALPNRYLSSSSLARIPLTCSIKRSVRLAVEQYRLAASLLMLVVACVAYARNWWRNNAAASAQVPGLVDVVLQRLANQRELGEEGLDDPWLFLPNLRDDVLRNVHSIRDRERIWQRVRKVVELNSNVRTSQREGRSGEVGRVWEWIGPTAGEGARRRISGRVSFGPGSRSESPAQGMTETKKWNDPRPIY